MPIILIRGNLASYSSYSSKTSPFRVMVSGLKSKYTLQVSSFRDITTLANSSVQLTTSSQLVLTQLCYLII